MNRFAGFAPLTLAVLLIGCGQDSPAPASSAPASASAATGAPTTAAKDVAEAHPGERAYKSTCSLCHASGTAGAPMLGDKADWAPRIAQGKDTLYKHTIEGYTGAKGMMPPRGTAMSLSDEELKLVVDYMVSRAQ
jgi:cytochrome c5